MGIPQDCCRRLNNSMPSRIQQVWAAKGEALKTCLKTTILAIKVKCKKSGHFYGSRSYGKYADGTSYFAQIYCLYNVK
jgi:hypothetical protein